MQYNIGIIGYGNMANYHIRVIPTPAEIKFTKAYDISKESNERAQKAGLETCKSAEELLNDEELSIVLVATPPIFHSEYEKKALLARKHLILEKPATMNARELEELIAIAKEKSLLFTVHHNRRNDNDFLVIKKVIQTGEMGKIFRLESRIQGPRGIADTWRRKKEYGGGLLYDWGCHLIDHILELVDSKVVFVYADFQYLFGYGVDDNIRVNLMFANGGSALVEIGTCNFINLPVWYVAGRKATAVIQEWNEEGRLVEVVDLSQNILADIPRSKIGPSITFAPCAPGMVVEKSLPSVEIGAGKFYKNIYAALEGKEELWVKSEECLRVAKIIDACFVSGKRDETSFAKFSRQEKRV